MREHNLGKKSASLFVNIFLLISSALCIMPIVWLIYSSLKTQQEFDINSIAFPINPTFTNFAEVLTQSNMFRYMLNSLRTTFLSVFFILLFGFITGYFIGRFDFKGRKFIYGYYLLGMLVPIHSLLVPMYYFFTKTHLSNKWFTLIPPYIAFGIPIAIYLMESYIKNVPKELEEAAAIDGAGFTRTLFQIILPVTRPVLATTGIISFFNSWNEFSFALILTTDEKLRTVPLGLTLFKGPYATDYPKMMAAMSVTIIPVIILYAFFSKEIIKGMMSGAVKG